MIVCHPCKSVWRRRHCNLIVLDNPASLPPRTRRVQLGRDRAQSGHYPRARESPGYAVRPSDYTLPQGDTSDAGQGTWMRSRRDHTNNWTYRPMVVMSTVFG